jgi:hypothetical protein
MPAEPVLAPGNSRPAKGLTIALILIGWSKKLEKLNQAQAHGGQFQNFRNHYKIIVFVTR